MRTAGFAKSEDSWTTHLNSSTRRASHSPTAPASSATSSLRCDTSTNTATQRLPARPPRPITAPMNSRPSRKAAPALALARLRVLGHCCQRVDAGKRTGRSDSPSPRCHSWSPLQAATRQTPQCRLFDGARQAARRSPRAPVRDKSMSGVDHDVGALWNSEHGSQGRLCKGKLLPADRHRPVRRSGRPCALAAPRRSPSDGLSDLATSGRKSCSASDRGCRHER